MAKRVSLKGKGAELFFGELPVELPAAQPLADREDLALPGQAPQEVLMDDAGTPAQRVAAEQVEQDLANALPAQASPPRPGRAASRLASTLASTSASNNEAATQATSATTAADVIDTIRKTVKQPGREVSFVRLTAEEKGRLADIVYTYKRQGLKTSENEINRIAVNYLIDDYHEHGEHSVLAQVLAALRA